MFEEPRFRGSWAPLASLLLSLFEQRATSRGVKEREKKRIISHFLKRPTEADVETDADASAEVEADGPQSSINHPHFYSKPFFSSEKKHLSVENYELKKVGQMAAQVFFCCKQITISNLTF